jgi:actin-like ATPase involved in cell morphogenesis
MVSRKSVRKGASKARETPARSRSNGRISSAQAAGLDPGTSTVVTACKKGAAFRSARELNAFIDLPPSRFTEQILDQNGIDFVREGRRILVYGNGAAKFANMFNAETRRPMRHGLVNATEPYAQRLLQVLVKKLLGDRKQKGNLICFSVPGKPLKGRSSLVYHEALMKQMLEGMGYEAKSINEGLAVVFSELEKENFSGIGISFGGGLTNVALAYLSVPVFSFAIDKGGDDIDEAVGKVSGETATRIRAIKEEGLDLNRKPKTKIEGALHIYYEDLITTVVESIQEALARTERMPKLDHPLPVVLAGGSALPKGFKVKFDRALTAQKLPIPLAGVSLGKDPLTATARGALLAALYEN